MKFCASLALSTFLVSPFFLAHAQGPAPAQQLAQPSAPLSISQKTEIPGASLGPGSYTIRIADQLRDRVIIEVKKANGSNVATFLAYYNKAIGGSTGPISFDSGIKSKPTLRGFAFSSGSTVEFIYPKKDAVTLAKSNNVQVMAVDPASEGRPNLPNLTQTDMDEVTLWMLTPTPVQPSDGKPGIQAARYQAPSPAPSQSSAPVSAQVTAQPAYVPAPASNVPSSSASIAPAKRSAPPTQVASNERPHIRPAVKQLPRTASSLPEVFLLGCFSLFAASLLTMRRLLVGDAK